MNASELHIKGLTDVINQMETLYPSTTIKQEAVSAVEIITIPPVVSLSQTLGALTEADAELFSRIYFELLALPETEVTVFLKLLSMLARKETQSLLYTADDIHSLVKVLLPETRQRVLLFTLPTTTAKFFDFLQAVEADPQLDRHILEDLKLRTADYFSHLGEFAQSMTELTSYLPTLLPTDREVLNNFLRASAPAKRELPFLFLFVGEQLVLDIGSNVDRLYQVETCTAKIRAYLREMGGQFEEPSIELFPFGGGHILCRENQFFLIGHNEAFELAFAEPEQPMSNHLMSRLVAIKFSFATQILRNAFPEYNFISQL
jgi:hypothetical protein